MIRKNNKTCICCNTKYTFCTRCDDFDFEPRWKAIFHDENCKDIFNLLTDYNAGNIDKETAINNLKKLDLSNIDIFKDNLQKEIKDLLKEEDLKKKNNKKVEKSVK